MSIPGLSSRASRAPLIWITRRPAKALWGLSAPLIRQAARRPALRAGLELGFALGGRFLHWVADGREFTDPGAILDEWVRILGRLELRPLVTEETGAPRCASFDRCSLGLKEGDHAACDTAMVINGELIARIGGRMEVKERLVDRGGTRCRVEIHAASRAAPEPGATGLRESGTWCTPAVAQQHFDHIAPTYDPIMGWFEIPSNRKALGRLLPRGQSALGGKRFLDLGCGTGLGLAELLDRLPPSARIVAVDRSAGMIAESTRRISRRSTRDLARVDFARVEGAELPFARASFDGLYCSFLLDMHEAPTRQGILRETRRVVKRGARAALVVMDGAPESAMDRALSDAYSLGYGRWNPIWMALLDNYAPHCRPVDLVPDLATSGWRIVEQHRSYVSAFPVVIFIVE